MLRRAFATPGKVVTHVELIDKLSHIDSAMNKHRLEMLVHRLRRKVQSETSAILPLRSVRGLGYVIGAPAPPKDVQT
jgi:DNA-binding response OmpR family regulator